MIQCSDKSKSKRTFTAQQMLGTPRPGPIAAAVFSHEDIAQRAYEIHVEKGRRQGRSEQDWLQAEQELKSRQNWLQDGSEKEDRDWAGGPCGPLNHTDGGRSCSVCNTIRPPAISSSEKC
jgi:hypothetical protein